MGALTRTSDRIGMGAVILLGLSIPISTGLDSVLTAAVPLFWVIGMRYRDKFDNLVHNPVVLGCFVVLFAYLAGSLYSIGNREDILESLGDARIFLLMPLFMSFFCFPEIQRWGIKAFTTALVATLILSFLLWFDLLPALSIMKGLPSNPSVFKYHITHNILMAFGGYLFATLAWNASSRGGKILFTILSILAVFNVLFMVQGRTGYVITGALLTLFLVQAGRWKGLAILTILLLLIGGGAYFHKDNALYERTSLTFQEMREWAPGQKEPGSTGQRLDFYLGSFEIIRGNLLLGVGTGGFKKAYADIAAGANLFPSDNPHNEYLLVASQLGIIGLLCYALLFAVQWRYASRLDDRSHQMLARGLIVTILSASLVSSTLIDHTEGLFYAWMSALLYAGVASDFWRRVPHVPFGNHHNEK